MAVSKAAVFFRTLKRKCLPGVDDGSEYCKTWSAFQKHIRTYLMVILKYYDPCFESLDSPWNEFSESIPGLPDSLEPKVPCGHEYFIYKIGINK